jgi:signal transduction histidine kinase
MLCIENAEEDIFYIVESGAVEVTKKLLDGKEQWLRNYGPGDFFGEMALISNSPRNASVRTTETTTVLEIDKGMFIELLRDSPIVALTMVSASVERLRSNDRLMFRELNAQKQAVEQAYAELQAEERRRTEFLTSLSHELRTPLTSASGFMQMIQKGNISGPILTMALEKVGNGLEQIVSLVNDLLFIQEMELIEPIIKPVNLHDIIRRIVEESEDAASDNGITIAVTMPPELPPLQADPDGLARALGALLDNAIKFSPEGGEITVTVTVVANAIDIAIRDPGIGIESDYLPRIFKRFEHRDSYGEHLFGGIGLGLPIAKHLIESFGGSISVDTAPGQGSTFTVHLPVLMGQPETSGN